MNKITSILLLAVFVLSASAQKTIKKGDYIIPENKYSPAVLNGLTKQDAVKLLAESNVKINGGSPTGNDYAERSVLKKFLGDTAGAFDDDVSALSIDPGNLYALADRATIYEGRKQYAEAMADINRAIKINASSPPLYNNRGYLYQVQGKNEEALQDYNKAIGMDSLYIQPYVNKVHLYISLDKMQEAEAICNRLISMFPDEPKAWLERSNLYKESGNTEAALGDINKAVEVSGNHPDMLVERCLFKDEILNDDAGAVKDADAAIALAPGNGQYYNARSRPLYDLQQYDKVIEDCSKALALDSTLLNAYIMRGNAYDMAGKSELAIKDYEAAIKKFPRKEDGYLQLCVLYSRQDDPAKVASTANRYLAFDSTNQQMLGQRGTASMFLHDFKQAKKDFTSIISLNPKVAEVFYCRGLVEDSLGEKENACKDMLAAFKLLSSKAHQYLRKHCRSSLPAKLVEAEDVLELALAKEKEGDYAGAIKDYDKIIALLPDSAIGYFNRGKMKRMLNDFEGAIPDFKKAVSLNDKMVEAWVYIGVCQHFLGKDEEAVAAYKLAIKADPSHEMAYFNIGLLLANQHKIAEAIPYLKSAVFHKHDYVKAYLALAECDLQVGDKAGACEAFRAAEALGDGSAIAKRIMNCE